MAPNLSRAGGGLDEWAVLEERLEGVHESGAGLCETLLEMLFDAGEGKFQIGEDEFVGLTPEYGDELTLQVFNGRHAIRIHFHL